MKDQKKEQRAPLPAAEINPSPTLFETIKGGVLRVTLLGELEEGGLGRAVGRIRHVLLGQPLASAEEPLQRLSKLKALPILASDNISSSAYATEEILRVLALAGAGALSFTMPVTLALLAVLAVVVLSYSQLIPAYSTGGGSYQAAWENLGKMPGLVAASSLLIDYVLTVAVSVAAGVAAVTSAFPALYDSRVLIGVLLITVLVAGNLRGIRESGTIFSIPTYMYLAGILGLLGYGAWRHFTGTLPAYTPPAGEASDTVKVLGLFLLLRAFSSGAVALTGVEAVSNGVRVFKPPVARNAVITLMWMGALFGLIFFGVSYLSTEIGIVPDSGEAETVLSQLTRVIAGHGAFYYFIQAVTALILVLAANTAFVDFPRLSAVLAEDRYMPNQFSRRGDRLALSTGIIVVGGLAALLVVVFRGSVSSLIPLYTVGVFVAFTLSQAGMVVYWRRVKSRGWRTAMVINGLGAAVTAVVATEAVIVKFTHGAWVVFLLVPLLVLLMIAINRHYMRLRDSLRLAPDTDFQAVTASQLVLLPVAGLNKAVAVALAYARSLSHDLRAVYVTDSPERAAKLEERWHEKIPDIPLIIIESPHRNWMGPLLKYIEATRAQHPSAPITIVIPEFVARHWWEHFLHSQSALRLRMALLQKRNVVVVEIPYQLLV